VDNNLQKGDQFQFNNMKGESQRRTALIQLSGAKVILLIHSARMTTLPDLLLDILCNPRVVKAGVAARGDVLKLHRDFDVKSKGVLDLGQVQKEVYGDKESSYTLASMISRTFGLGMAKDQNIRTGNWECVPLSGRQIRYASDDAYVLRLLTSGALYTCSVGDG
jgi:ribonuclease D